MDNPLILHQLRYSEQREDDTLGLLFLNGNFECYILEDEEREVKVDGETRIPAGVYEIKLRTEGGMHSDYLERYPTMHKGMLHYQDVPGFEWIQMHIGNKNEHTDGCPLTGDTCSSNIEGPGFVGHSTRAYKRVYPKITAAIEAGRRVFVWVGDIELPEVDLSAFEPKQSRKRRTGQQ